MKPDIRSPISVDITDADFQLESRIILLREGGMTFKAVGETLGLTASRVRHLYLRGRGRRAGRKPAWTDGLNQRLAKSLRWLEFKNREEVVEALKSGHMQRLATSERGLSPTALAELAQWVESSERLRSHAVDQMGSK